jgi:hypothetical protein
MLLQLQYHNNCQGCIMNGFYIRVELYVTLKRFRSCCNCSPLLQLLTSSEVFPLKKQPKELPDFPCQAPKSLKQEFAATKFLSSILKDPDRCLSYHAVANAGLEHQLGRLENTQSLKKPPEFFFAPTQDFPVGRRRIRGTITIIIIRRKLS